MSRLALLALLLPGLALAELRADGADWDDLGRWISGGRTAGMQVLAEAPMDLGRVPPGSGLALLAPGPVADPAGVRRFVQEGGRVMIAVDGPEADGLLRTFETRSVDAPTTGEHLGGLAALVVLRPPNARIFAEVGALVANHPVGLAPIGALDPAIRFSDGTPFAYLLKLGEGELLLVGDASLFINLMLEAGGNGRFGANVLAWLSRQGAAPVSVVAGGVPLEGSYGEPPPADDVDGLNRALAGLGGDQAPDALLVHMLLALLLAAATAYTLVVFPGRTGRPLGLGHPSMRAGPVERAAGAPGGPADPDTPTSELT